MARRILPALRGLESKSVRLDEVEGKSLTIDGSAFGDTAPRYSSIARSMGGFGDRGRADGWDLNGRVIDSYERGVWTFKCVEYIANHQSRLPFRIGSGRGTENEQVLDDHPLYRVMNKRANSLETGRAFRKRLSAQLLLSKKGVFVEVTKSRAGTITKLELLDPSRVTPILDTDGEYVDYFEFFHRSGLREELSPGRVRWIRDAHPIDPFCGVVPMEAAGASIQLDALARLYNVSFIQNDGRPGGIVGIDADGLEEAELERIDRIFSRGAQSAGEIKVVGTGPGGLNYVDTTTRPRDMAYGEMSATAKNEVLSAFGLGESLFGNAAGRTFDNAEQEKYNAWSETLVPHFELVASAFDEDVDEDLDPFIDTRTVDVLEIPRRKRREEALQEFNAGLRSVNEYRPLAGLPELDSAFARAVWISPSKAPIPGRPGDEAALGLVDPNAAAVEPAATNPGITAAQTVAEARGELPPGAGPAAAAVSEARGELDPPLGEATATVAEARSMVEGAGEAGDAAAAVDEARAPLQGKVLDPGTPTQALGWQPEPDQVVRLETALAASLDAIAARQQAVIQARLESPKARKGTRYWEPENPADERAGQAPIDTADIVQADRWAEEVAATVEPLVQQSAVESSATILAALAAAGVIAGAGTAAAGVAPAAMYGAAAVQLTQETVEQAVQVAVSGMRAWLRGVQRKLEVEQLSANSVADLTETVAKAYGEDARGFASRLALTIAEATVNGTSHATAAGLLPLPGPGGSLSAGVTLTWVSQRDDRVRPSHQPRPTGVDGTTVAVGDRFLVGNAYLRFPGDPEGPPEEVLGCRCTLRVSTSRSSRLLLPPS